MTTKSPHWHILKKMFIGFTVLLVISVLFIGVALFRLYRQVSGYKTYWNNRAASMVESNSIYYVALGDSAAQGIGASSPDKGYVGLIAKSIQQQTNRPVHVINLSKTGATVQTAIQEQLPKLKQLRVPSDAIVTVEIGANDLINWDEEKFRRGMDQFMSELPPQTIISDMPYFGEGRYRKVEGRAQSANKIIHELANKRKLKIAPLYKVTKSNSSIFNITIDLFHPSNRGYRNWHEAFVQKLER